MKNKRKVSILASMFVGMSMVLIAFQNFTPHDPMKNQDGRDLYMNHALMKALKDADAEKKAQQDAIHAENDPAFKEREMKVITLQVGEGIDTADSGEARSPASSTTSN
ncbi:MAG: hypothetical protein K2Q26_06855 [Bdellovibrionales bacterium]|nr:hypothetical protein [Bdellovibrionales bacterium]